MRKILLSLATLAFTISAFGQGASLENFEKKKELPTKKEEAKVIEPAPVPSNIDFDITDQIPIYPVGTIIAQLGLGISSEDYEANFPSSAVLNVELDSTTVEAQVAYAVTNFWLVGVELPYRASGETSTRVTNANPVTTDLDSGFINTRVFFDFYKNISDGYVLAGEIGYASKDWTSNGNSDRINGNLRFQHDFSHNATGMILVSMVNVGETDTFKSHGILGATYQLQYELKDGYFIRGQLGFVGFAKAESKTSTDFEKVGGTRLIGASVGGKTQSNQFLWEVGINSQSGSNYELSLSNNTSTDGSISGMLIGGRITILF